MQTTFYSFFVKLPFTSQFHISATMSSLPKRKRLEITNTFIVGKHYRAFPDNPDVFSVLIFKVSKITKTKLTGSCIRPSFKSATRFNADHNPSLFADYIYLSNGPLRHNMDATLSGDHYTFEHPQSCHRYTIENKVWDRCAPVYDRYPLTYGYGYSMLGAFNTMPSHPYPLKPNTCAVLLRNHTDLPTEEDGEDSDSDHLPFAFVMLGVPSQKDGSPATIPFTPMWSQQFNQTGVKCFQCGDRVLHENDGFCANLTWNKQTFQWETPDGTMVLNLCTYPWSNEKYYLQYPSSTDQINIVTK